MLDQQDIRSDTFNAQAVETYDLVVVGAGIAGLNALYAAVQYMPKGARVMLIDQKTAAGGMWNTAYDYVRLHQPHPMFTVGDMKWDWRKPAGYLAARDEVQKHLAGSIGAVSDEVELQTAFGTTVSTCREIETNQGHRAEIKYHPNTAPSDTTRILAHRAIHASGLNYVVPEPLTFCSDQVVSIAPSNLQAALEENPQASVVVVGGGKTGMDTVLATLAENPQREVTLIKGRGTNFLNRTKLFANGMKRWTSGQLISRLFHDIAVNFDGDNEDHTLAFCRSEFSTDPDGDNQVFLYGLQSEDEWARITAGLSETVPDYLMNVSDAADGPVMSLRSGSTCSVKPGTVFVNCTGSFFRVPEMGDDTPCLSPQGTIMSINARDSFHFLTSVGGFFLTHLLYREELRGRGFYTIDHEKLFRTDRNAWVGASAAHAYMNQTIAVQTLPMRLLDSCGLDLDRWYPLPRRMAGLMRMKANAKADIAHCRKTLDRVAQRFELRCGPLG